MKTLKVWGGLTVGEKLPQVRRIVAAYTKKQACELAGLKYHYFKDYWSETGSKVELDVAKEVGVWDSEVRYSDDPKTYKRVLVSNWSKNELDK